MRTYHIQAGYPGIQHSGKVTNFAPLLAASSINSQVFATVASRSSHTGSACATATLIADEGVGDEDIVETTIGSKE